MIWKRLLIGSALFIIALLLCLDLLTTNAKPSSFDGLIHMSNIAQYHVALKDGDFPVRWLDKTANYGMPIPLFSQQTVAYIGAFLMFFFNNTLITYNVVILLFAILSNFSLYYFLREYIDKWGALVGTFLFCFAPYRIINIYIRGAIPEFAASFFLPIILLSMKRWIQNKDQRYYFVLIISLFLLFITHPISTTVYSFIIGVYYLFLLWKEKNKLETVIKTIVAGLISLGLASFYLIPLLREFKYLYYGLNDSVFLPNSYLEYKNLLNPGWYYFSSGDILTRAHYLHIGLIETAILFIGLIYIIFKLFNRKKVNPLFLVLYLLVFIYIILLTKIGTPIFYWIKPLGNIQHQWRLLSGILFIPPIVAAYLLKLCNRNTKIIIGTLIIIFVIIFRFPQLYGKNYLQTNESTYFSSKDNLYAQVMNTIWTGPTQEYPEKKLKGEVIAGRGKIISRKEHNSWRQYEVDATEKVRLADYTFYFPGWKVSVDNKEVPIQFQDEKYRGVITYDVPQGKHSVLVKFTNTKIRLLSNLISLFSFGILVALFILRKKLFRHSPKKRS